MHCCSPFRSWPPSPGGKAAETPDAPVLERDQVLEVITYALADSTGTAEHRSVRRGRPRQLGPCNVLTVSDAVAELRMGKAEGKEWLVGVVPV